MQVAGNVADADVIRHYQAIRANGRETAHQKIVVCGVAAEVEAWIVDFCVRRAGNPGDVPPLQAAARDIIHGGIVGEADPVVIRPCVVSGGSAHEKVTSGWCDPEVGVVEGAVMDIDIGRRISHAPEADMNSHSTSQVFRKLYDGRAVARSAIISCKRVHTLRAHVD